MIIYELQANHELNQIIDIMEVLKMPTKVLVLTEAELSEFLYEIARSRRRNYAKVWAARLAQQLTDKVTARDDAEIKIALGIDPL